MCLVTRVTLLFACDPVLVMILEPEFVSQMSIDVLLKG